MAVKTLFEVSKPIIFNMNFLGYRLGWEQQNSGGACAKGLLKWMLKLNVFLFFILFTVMAAHITFAVDYGSNCMTIYYAFRAFMILLAVTFLDYFVLINETQMRNLVHQFKLFPVMKESGKALKKCLRPFYTYALFNAAVFVIIFPSAVLWAFAADNISTIIKILCLWTILSLFSLIQFPVFLCCFACLVPIYCEARVKELVQEVESARSSLRRAKMTSDLLREYYRLKRLASMTDETVSKAMSIFHELFKLLFALTVVYVNSFTKLHYEHDKLMELMTYFLFSAIFVAYVFPFLTYTRVAPSTNQMHSLIFRCLVVNEWLSRDPILRPLLIKMRVSHVFDVSHIALKEASFTLFGEAIEGETLFTTFLEAFDMYNTIAAHPKPLSISSLNIQLNSDC